MLSEFQKKKLAHFFGLLDFNRNGFLQLNDFSDIAENIRIKLHCEIGSKKHKLIADKSVKLFYKLLKDIPHPGNRVIRLNEWLDFFAVLIEEHDEEAIDEYVEVIMGFLFDFFDENHDGYISVEEYSAIFELYNIDAAYSQKAFTKLDLSKDNRLSRYELVHAVETFLTSDDPEMKGNWIFGNWEAIEKK